ncbi:MAG TPA: nitrilase-related carbon-nitrogen hydrolase, partial [Bacteroidales bacterium]|nr:nitrilase-related carbon-nitrogen hydrolase [Bacteroidales bacterium]
MKIALAQLNFTIGDFEHNRKLIINNILKAKSLGADVIAFPELAVSGYPPRDFLNYDHFIDHCFETLQSIATVCHGITAIVGCPVKNPEPFGKRLYNSAAVLGDGKILSTIYKSLLPNYDVFDEYRYFEPARSVEVVAIKAGRLAITICEDLWGLSDHPLYLHQPMNSLIAQQPDVILNIAASPFHYRQAIERRKVLVRNAKQYKLPLFYVNHTGGQTELLFDGDSMVIDAGGRIVDQLPWFSEELRVYDTSELSQLEPTATHYDETGLIHKALVTGIRDYFRKSGFSKAILGLSGGLDSA